MGPSHYTAEPRAATPPSPAQAQAQIDEWLNTGKPFFPRDAIQAIHDQLRGPLPRGGELTVQALDGATVAFRVRTGDATEIRRQRGIIGKPSIGYISYESLRSEDRRPHLVYCPMIILHAVVLTEPPSVPRRSREDVHCTFTAALHLWEESDTWSQVKRTLLATHALTSVKRIVAFACGTMSHTDDIPGASYDSIFQHALLTTTQSLLQRETEGQILCSVQDPAYTDADRAVLDTHGIRVLDDPEGFLEVDGESLIFSCCPNVPVKQIVVDLARPAVIIWDRVKDGSSGGTDPDSPRVQQVMAQSYDALEFPYEEHFGDLVIYVRRELRAAGRIGVSTEAINEPQVPNA
ncbi:hypothetical protein BJY00DRAFT_319597 [Aspergillus carlsbadensis]|nr:hypothetical protein BJY00DRAFT_319597 [Aspergillus carlsbadensis]